MGGFTAFYDISKKMGDLKKFDAERVGGVIGGTFGKVFGATDQARYLDLRTEIIDLLARARTGAALTASEEKFYSDQLPGRFTEAFFLGVESSVRLDNFETKIKGALESKLGINGASIYGFSKIKINGQDYTVGDIISVNGIKGRILPDGSVSVIQE